MRSLVKILVAAVVVLAPVRARAQENATVAAERVNVRATPARDGKLVMTLARGTSVTVLERRDAWSKVSARAKSGWVRSNSLAVVAGKAAPPASTSSAAAQRSAPQQRRATAAPRRGVPPTGAFHAGDNILGPVVGLGGINGTMAVGGELEHGIKTLPSLGNGLLALSAQVFYYHYTFALVPGAGVTAIPFGAAANYHFALKDQRIDPFVGLGLGYTYASVSAGTGGTVTGGSGVFFWGRAGVRYFVKPALALHVDAGLGSANLNIGVMLRP